MAENRFGDINKKETALHVTSLVGESNNGIQENLDNIEGDITDIDERNKAIEQLLSQPDLSQKERDEYREELDLLKNDTANFKKRLMVFLEKVADKVGRGIERTIDAYSDNFGENKKKIRMIDFILNNLDIENRDEIISKFEEKKKKHNLYGIELANFPLDDAGLEILNTCTKKINIKDFYNIEELIRFANKIYTLNKDKGLSLNILMKLDKWVIDYQLSTSSPENDILIQKLKLIDGTDIISNISEIYLHGLEAVSIDQLKLLIENKYINFDFSSNFSIDFKNIAEVLNEDNLEKASVFFADVEKVNIEDFVLFVNKISNLDIRIQNIIKEESVKKGHAIRYLSYGKSLDFFKSLESDKIDLLIFLIDLKFVNINNSYDLDKIEKYDISLISKLKIFPEEDLHKLEYHLESIGKLNEHEFNIFLYVYDKQKKSIWLNVNELITLSVNIYSEFGEDYDRCFNVIDKVDLYQDVSVMKGDLYYIKKIKTYSDWSESSKDIDLIELSNNVFGKDWSRRLEPIDTQGIKDIILRNKYVSISNSFTNFEQISEALSKINIFFSEQEKDDYFNYVLLNYPTLLAKEFSFKLTPEQKRLSLDRIILQLTDDCMDNFTFIYKYYFSELDDASRQEYLSELFNSAISKCPVKLLDCKDFPFTQEQRQYIEIFKQIQESPSAELKNIANEVIPLLSKYNNIEEAYDALRKIEQVFLTNNMPLVGKQYKIFEILYSDERFSYSIHRSKVESLKSLKEPSRQRLTIFKDLMMAHISSADKNLEQYLNILKENKDILKRFESGQILSDDEKNKIKLFIKKINTLTDHIGRESISLTDAVSDEDLKNQLSELSKSFGVGEGQGIIDRFERTFLKRIGINSIEEALDKMNQYKINADKRNESNIEDGFIKVQEGDFIKGISSEYLDTYLDRGIYAPEFIGAESINTKNAAKNSDLTPFDTDLSRVRQGEGLLQTLNSYGDIYLIVKQKPQLTEDGLDIFKTGVIADNHYGIRTGFGSTNIDAICTSQKGLVMDKIKFFIAQKGFYIPICDTKGEVVFTREEYDKYRQIFAGNNSLKGPNIEISEVWKISKNLESIRHIAQTEDNLEKMSVIKNKVIDKIKGLLETVGIKLHQGEYDDSLLGAIITDTGSTGRGSALDEKYDFDFAVKLDDNQWDKVSELMRGLEQIFPKSDSYENRGMMMFRSSDVEIDGQVMTIDVGFNKKSNSESFDAHDALNEKYKSIEKTNGRQALLDVLTNIRFAKKKLKEAGCYKKGLGDNGQQGGLGGIGVEYWIIQNGGDAIRAFRDFANNAYENDKLISFEDFKKKYKIFSAGQNIRGGIKVENFTYNMTESGYIKMAELSRELTQ